jgi:hypothetical protein
LINRKLQSVTVARWMGLCRGDVEGQRRGAVVKGPPPLFGSARCRIKPIWAESAIPFIIETQPLVPLVWSAQINGRGNRDCEKHHASRNQEREHRSSFHPLRAPSGRCRTEG